MSIIVLMVLLYLTGLFDNAIMKAIEGGEKLVDLKWFLISILLVITVCFDWLADIKDKGVSFFIVFLLGFFAILFTIMFILFSDGRITSTEFAYATLGFCAPIIIIKSTPIKNRK